MSGDDDWEELQDDLSDLANIAGYGQRAETNRLLREQQAERKRLKSLPQCWHCGGRLELRGAKICPHCRTELKWLKIKGSQGPLRHPKKKPMELKQQKSKKHGLLARGKTSNTERIKLRLHVMPTSFALIASGLFNA